MVRILVLIHLAAVIVWIGGMFFAHFCLRPVAAQQLPPPQRLPLLHGVLRRFFGFVTVSLVLLWGSGLVLYMNMGTAPWSVAAMAGIAGVMTAIFGFVLIRFGRMHTALAGGNLPAAGQAMDGIRKLVLTNLVLGGINVGVAILGPLLA